MHSSVAYSMMQNLIPRFTCQCGFRRAASLKSSTPLILRIKRAKEFISPVFIRHHLKEGFFDSWKCHILIADILYPYLTGMLFCFAAWWKKDGDESIYLGESKVEPAEME